MKNFRSDDEFQNVRDAIILYDWVLEGRNPTRSHVRPYDVLYHRLPGVDALSNPCAPIAVVKFRKFRAKGKLGVEKLLPRHRINQNDPVIVALE